MLKIGVLILAAGSSSRLGRAKQLLFWKGQSLLAHSYSLVEPIAFHEKIWVYGARKNEIEPALQDLNAPMVYNPDWATGMGSSIRTGVKAILAQQADLTAMLILLVDQPLIQTAHLKVILDLHKKQPTAIIAATYNNVLGVPVLFPKRFFSTLMELKEQAGAKKIIKKFQDQVIPFSCPEAAFDIDTEADYEHLLSH